VPNDEVRTAANEGIAFMDDGDPIFASHNEIRRIDATKVCAFGFCAIWGLISRRARDYCWNPGERWYL